MTPEFIVNMLQEEFHIIIVLTFRSNKGQYFFFIFCFRNSISCIFNCDDLLCIYFFILQFHYY